MNLSNRISKLEKLVAGRPEINREHVAALVRFLETGDEGALPPEGIERNETLMITRMIPVEDADSLPGLARIAEAMKAPRLWRPRPEGGSRDFEDVGTPAQALAVLKELDPTDTVMGVVFGPGPNDLRPTPDHRLLAGLGIIKIYRVHHDKRPLTPKEQHEIEQKRTDS